MAPQEHNKKKNTEKSRKNKGRQLQTIPKRAQNNTTLTSLLVQVCTQDMEPPLQEKLNSESSRL